MKKYLLPICLLGLGPINFISCYQDDEEELFNCEDLSISRHTTLTRSGMNESWDINQNKGEEMDNYIKRNRQYPKEENYCFLTVIVEQWIEAVGDGHFRNNPCSPTATEFYNMLKQQFDSLYPDWNEESNLYADDFMNLTKGIKVNETPLFSDHIDFNEMGTTAVNYFSTSSNRTKVSAILLEKNGSTRGHMAYVSGYEGNYIKFKGEDILGNGNKININGESGWSIIGVILK